MVVLRFVPCAENKMFLELIRAPFYMALSKEILAGAHKPSQIIPRSKPRVLPEQAAVWQWNNEL
jgi:hypothetical protein